MSYTRATVMSTGLGLTSTSATSRCASRFFPALLAPQTSSSPMSAASPSQQSRPFSHRSQRITSPTRGLTTRTTHKPLSLISRSASTSTSTPTSPQTTTPTPTPAPSSSSSPSSSQPLTWNTYLSLRQKRRHYNLFSSIVTGSSTFAGGVSFLMTQDLEKLSSILFGVDPVMALGMGGVAFGTLGWLAGPFAGEAVFRVVYRRWMGQMEIKEKDFYHRIKKYRCDPSTQSVSNPVPDYYGEKISSVQGYRQWLKDQRAFRKKRETPMSL